MSVAFTEEVGEGAVHELHETVDIGCDDIQFSVRIEFDVLASDAGAMDVQIHSTKIGNQSKQVTCGIDGTHVNASRMDSLRCLGFDFFETLSSSSCNAEFPAFGKQLQCHFLADSGCCADDDCLRHAVFTPQVCFNP